jgi:hypothetical protein
MARVFGISAAVLMCLLAIGCRGNGSRHARAEQGMTEKQGVVHTSYDGYVVASDMPESAAQTAKVKSPAATTAKSAAPTPMTSAKTTVETSVKAKEADDTLPPDDAQPVSHTRSR